MALVICILLPYRSENNEMSNSCTFKASRVWLFLGNVRVSNFIQCVYRRIDLVFRFYMTHTYVYALEFSVLVLDMVVVCGCVFIFIVQLFSSSLSHSLSGVY